MTYPAVNIDEIFESEAVIEQEQDCDILDFESHQRESLSENFNAELDAWARHCLAANGFGDY